MKINYLYFFLIVFVFGCTRETSIKLEFVDEYVLRDSTQFKHTLVGGISGIDYNNGNYYMVVDDSKSPRVLKAKIKIKQNKISSIDFTDVIHLDDSISFFKNNFLDLESVFVDEQNHINLVSEGFIKDGKDPSIFVINKQGDFVGSYGLPKYFKANSNSKPRHNAVFEASCKSFDKYGFWIGMEGVLEVDGEEPSQLKEKSPIRITYYDVSNNEATNQFVYLLDAIKKPVKGDFNVNGVTAILEYAKNTFFVVERAYQSGYGINGNIVKIYKVVLDEQITNTLKIPSLKDKTYTAVKKELVFDFDDVRGQLTEGIIDNIEGITLGPKLSNGNESLILISDDNFQRFNKQLNQFILLEISQ